MARTQRRYDTEFKVQAVTLAREVGTSQAARELDISPNTLHGWVKAANIGHLDLGPGKQTPQTALSLAEENEKLRRQLKEIEKENKRLKKENDFLEEASAFFAASRRKSTRTQD